MSQRFNSLSNHTKGLVLISLAALMWSTGGLFIKILEFDAYQISFFRSVIAGLTIFFIVKFKKENVNFKFDLISNLCAISYSGILILFVIATKLTTAANAIFLQFTAPIYLLFLEPVFLKTKFKLSNLITIVFCFIGMMLFFFGKLEMGDITGNILAICSGICFALFSLFLKWKKMKSNNQSDLGSVIIGNFLVGLIMFPFIFNNLYFDLSQFSALLYLGIFQIGVSYMIFNAGLKYVSATESMIIAMLEAVFNPIWVFIGVGERPSDYAILGGVIIFVTIFIHNIISVRKNKFRIAD
ncbi:MAG TPA: EamA family transporter [Bacteroidetes bacterium]|nr:EamA family transporter [Bacteroidota bacterium]